MIDMTYDIDEIDRVEADPLTMKKQPFIIFILTVFSLILLFSGCQKKQPDTIDNDAVFTENTINELNTFPNHANSSNHSNILADMAYPLSIDGIGISMDEYRYFYLTEKARMEQLYGSADLWMKPEAVNNLSDHTRDNIMREYAIRALAKKHAVSLTEQDHFEISKMISDKKAELGGDILFAEWLQSIYSNEALYAYLLETKLLPDKIKTALFSKGGELHSSENDLLLQFNKTYFHTTHIRIPVDFENEIDFNEKSQLAMDLHNRAASGEDFDGLAAQFNQTPEDPEYPNSFFYMLGDLGLDIYEDTVYGIEIGDITEVMQMNGAFYIAKRLPLTETQIESAQSDFERNYYSEKYGDVLYAARSSLKIDYDPNYNKISIDTLT